MKVLHQLSWKNGATYGLIVKSHADFIVINYGLSTVVFDGYNNGTSINDNTHQKRVDAKLFTLKLMRPWKLYLREKKHFLSRNSYKQTLINLISSELRRKGCRVINSFKDEDVYIVEAAVGEFYLHFITLIGEDTDLLVLLLCGAKPD